MSDKPLTLKHFISQPISVQFSSPPAHTKSPPCPASFTWKNQTYTIKRCLLEGKDFSRSGRMARNMRPANARTARERGSWGVGRFFFEVQTTSNQYFRLYYDRAPENALDREGSWLLHAELTPKHTED
jgi:hypothetical protein